MIAFFPEAYPDELLYSQISRYHQRSGYARFVFTAEDIYRTGKVTHPSIEFVNRYTDDAKPWLKSILCILPTFAFSLYIEEKKQKKE